MTNTASETPAQVTYAELLLLAMLRQGVLQQTGPDEFTVVSDDRKKVAECFRQAAIASIAQKFPGV